MPLSCHSLSQAGRSVSKSLAMAWLTARVAPATVTASEPASDSEHGQG